MTNRDTYLLKGTVEWGVTVHVRTESGSLIGSVLSGPGAYFEIDVPLGTADTTLRTRLSATDVAGVESDSIPVWITRDTVPPKVTLEAGPAGSTTVTVTIDEAIDPSTLLPGSVTLNGVPIDYPADLRFDHFTPAPYGLTMTLAQPLEVGDRLAIAAATYVGIADLAGNLGPVTEVALTIGSGP